MPAEQITGKPIRRQGGSASSANFPQGFTFTNFFAKRARYPHFTSQKTSRKSAEYTTSAGSCPCCARTRR